MTELVGTDLRGARLERVDLTGASFRAVDLTGVRMRGVELVDVDITGEVWNVRVNGVDVVPLVPEPRAYPVRECLQVVLVEEWEHRCYAERDLAVLEARSG